jgi:hypothetical protein
MDGRVTAEVPVGGAGLVSLSLALVGDGGVVVTWAGYTGASMRLDGVSGVDLSLEGLTPEIVTAWLRGETVVDLFGRTIIPRRFPPIALRACREAVSFEAARGFSLDGNRSVMDLRASRKAIGLRACRQVIEEDV